MNKSTSHALIPDFSEPAIGWHKTTFFKKSDEKALISLCMIFFELDKSNMVISFGKFSFLSFLKFQWP